VWNNWKKKQKIGIRISTTACAWWCASSHRWHSTRTDAPAQQRFPGCRMWVDWLQGRTQVCSAWVRCLPYRWPRRRVSGPPIWSTLLGTAAWPLGRTNVPPCSKHNRYTSDPYMNRARRINCLSLIWALPIIGQGSKERRETDEKIGT